VSLQLFGHPFSSYTWKVLIALWADETPFKFRMLGLARAVHEARAYRSLFPPGAPDRD